MLESLVAFVVVNKETIGVVALGVWQMIQLGRSGWNSQLTQIALRLVRDVAASQLSNVEKRQRVVDGLKDKAPVLTKMFGDQQLHEIAEKAYQLLKAELKS